MLYVTLIFLNPNKQKFKFDPINFFFGCWHIVTEYFGKKGQTEVKTFSILVTRKVKKKKLFSDQKVSKKKKQKSSGKTQLKNLKHFLYNTKNTKTCWQFFILKYNVQTDYRLHMSL